MLLCCLFLLLHCLSPCFALLLGGGYSGGGCGMDRPCDRSGGSNGAVASQPCRTLSTHREMSPRFGATAPDVVPPSAGLSSVFYQNWPQNDQNRAAEPKTERNLFCNGALLDQEIGIEKLSCFEKQEARRLPSRKSKRRNRKRAFCQRG